MKKLTKVLPIIFIFLCGCASMPQTTDDYIANIEIAKQNAVKLAQISDFQTCFIRACLGNHIDQAPCEMAKTLDEIDLLMEEIGTDYESMTGCEKGKILGLWTRLVTLGILELVESINPGVLGALL